MFRSLIFDPFLSRCYLSEPSSKQFDAYSKVGPNYFIPWSYVKFVKEESISLDLLSIPSYHVWRVAFLLTQSAFWACITRRDGSPTWSGYKRSQTRHSYLVFVGRLTEEYKCLRPWMESNSCAATLRIPCLLWSWEHDELDVFGNLVTRPALLDVVYYKDSPRGEVILAIVIFVPFQPRAAQTPAMLSRSWKLPHRELLTWIRNSIMVSLPKFIRVFNSDNNLFRSLAVLCDWKKKWIQVDEHSLCYLPAAERSTDWSKMVRSVCSGDWSILRSLKRTNQQKGKREILGKEHKRTRLEIHHASTSWISAAT